MVSRNEIIGVALLGIALITKLRNNGDNGFIVNPLSFVRQATAQSSSDESFEESDSAPVINPNAGQISSLKAERKGILQALNNLIVPFFRRGFSFDFLGNVRKSPSFKFRTTAGATGIFGFRSAQTGFPKTDAIINRNPKKIATEATIKFGRTRLRAINEQLDSL